MAHAARAAQINPYAAPIESGGPPTPGIGAWREGPLLVMHKDAELPRICIHTGEPAAGAREFRLAWKGQGDLLSRGKCLYLPLRYDLLRSFARSRLQSLVGLAMGAISLLTILSLPFLFQLGDWVAPAVMLSCLAMGFVGVVLWCVNYRHLREPIKLVYGTADYLWFAGLHPAFLDRLPSWPVH
jgi:hypothetical protein